MLKNKKTIGVCIAMAACVLLVGCGAPASDVGDDNTPVDSTEEASNSGEEASSSSAEASETTLSDIVDYRKIPDTLPELAESPKTPGDRSHFLFVQNDKQYIFTETEDIWLYNQSNVNGQSTQLLLNMNKMKVLLIPVLGEEYDEFKASEYNEVFSEEGITIYMDKKDESGENNDRPEIETNTPMYVTVLDLVYKVDMWQDLLLSGKSTRKVLYEKLSQLGTSLEVAGATSDLTDVLTGLRAVPIMDEYKLAYREGLTHTGFIFCSPKSEKADYEDISLYMSVYLPEWESYVILHTMKQPDYVDRLEKTDAKFGEYDIYADYTKELKYFLLGEDGTCIYIDGVPGKASKSDKSFTVKEASYLFELLLTNE